ncbi:membrane protein [Hypericibacter terrae]|jgi:drug/metabolite transporter (DMT)-like permease|uniref:Membrane protein n=1 Tax=Hypericibacter terrae TaxID=2602015 RepID=A0A5J6MIM8_9PROT|nr:DMT family transporter [Hypericibacter terrae]QEX17412.1 membrane protein [Hypericibacter terrae]
MQEQNRSLGFLLLATATGFTATAGMLLRWLDEPAAWRTIFYRSLFFALTVIVWIAVTRKGRMIEAMRSVNLNGLLCALVFSLSTISFIFALFLTTVARTTFLNGLTPLLTGLLGWFALRERMSPATWLAILLALVGVFLMTAEDLTGGNLMGDGLALGASLSAAAMYVLMRRARTIDMLPSFVVAGFLTAALAAPWIADFSLSAHDLAICAALGIFQLGFQYVLLAMGVRHLPAAEAALTTRLSLIFAPLLAWIGAGEVPGRSTLIGGAVIVGAILLHGFWTLHGETRRAKLRPTGG